MSERFSQNIFNDSDMLQELESLRVENEKLRQANKEVSQYIRNKVDDLLGVIGTKPIRPDELDDHMLVEFDPIGIVTDSFRHVLENMRETNRKLSFAHNEIQAVFDTVGAAILVLNMQGEVIAYNQRTRDHLLKSNDVDIVGKRCREHICHLRTNEDRCVFMAVSHEQREQKFHDWTLNGNSFDVVGRPMFDENGEISHVVISYLDVTARRDAEVTVLKALTETQEANAKLHGLLRSVADSIVVTDAGGQVVLMNRRAEELFGLCLADRRVTLSMEALPHRELVVFLQGASKKKNGLQIKDFVFPVQSGRDRIYQARASVIDSTKTDFRGCVTILHDVTEEREIELMKSEFVSTAAHELRTPLATIIGYADLLLMKDDWSSDERKEYLELIQTKAERLGDIVGDLLDISRIESGEGVKLKPELCHLDELCKEIVRNFECQSRGHEFIVEAEDPTDVFADRFALLHILENVISNAVKYSPDGGLIKITISRRNCRCQCVISDQGIGMTSAQLEKIYDKFYRVDATDTAISGTGLGMTIVKHLVEAQGGKINISSTPGTGTAVTLSFPCAEELSAS